MWSLDDNSRIFRVFISAILFFAVLNFLGNVKRRTQDVDMYWSRVETLDDSSGAQQAVFSSDVDRAVKHMMTLHLVLKALDRKAKNIAEFINSTVFTARHDIELNIRAAGVSTKDMTELQIKLDACEKRIVTRSAELRDDLETLTLTVGFIVNDLAYNLANVVPSSVGYVTQFKKEFDNTYKNSRTYINMAANKAYASVTSTLGNRSGRHADAVREQLKTFADLLKQKCDNFVSTKRSYDKIKEKAFASLKAVIK